VSKGSLKYLGRSDAPENIQHAQKTVGDAVTTLMKEIVPHKELYEILEVKKNSVAIAVDLDEKAMGPRRFHRTVEQVLGVAIDVPVSLPSAPTEGTRPVG
jgi:hypothetical protein